MDRDEFCSGYWETKEVRVCSCGVMLETHEVITFHKDCTSDEHITDALKNGELVNIRVWRRI